MTQQETSLFNELRREVENHELTKKEIRETEARFKTLKYAFNSLLDEHCQKREVQGHDDIEEVRYRFMELSGLLEL
jgi:hypothetical protein